MKQFSRFISVGLLNTALGYSVIFTCMYMLSLSPEISNAWGYVVGLAASYILNKNFTFKSTGAHATELFRFLAVFAFAYTLNFLALVILIHRIGVNSGVSQVVAGCVYIAISFLLNKHYVFRNRKGNTDAAV